MTARLLGLILTAASLACGADHEFDRLVKAIESHYGVKRTQIPLMGVANLFVKVAHPAGTSGFKLAIFEDLPSHGRSDSGDLDQFIGDVCKDGLHPMVVTHSRRSGESSYVLVGDIGKSTRLLIATFESSEATLVEVTVNIDKLMEMVGSPDVLAHLGRDDKAPSSHHNRTDW